MKKIGNKILAGLFVYMATLPSAVFAAKGLEAVVNEINEWVQGSFVKPMLTLVIIAVFIYMAKNHDRIKEIWVMCLIIILSVVGIMNAKTIADWIGNAAS